MYKWYPLFWAIYQLAWVYNNSLFGTHRVYDYNYDAYTYA